MRRARRIELQPDEPDPRGQQQIARWFVAALLLLAMLRLNPFVEPWLAAKLALLPAYVVLGVMALRRARSPRSRIAWFVAALACFGMMVSIARAHHPLGFAHALLG